MTMLVALMGLVLTQAATSPAAPAAPAALQVSVPTVPGVTADPTCGGREHLTTIATCLATTQAGVEAAVDALNADFVTQGWIPADGRDNRIVYVKRRSEGGCDGFQLLAFGPDTGIIAPAAPAYLALAAIPGDICAAEPAAPATPPAQ